MASDAFIWFKIQLEIANFFSIAAVMRQLAKMLESYTDGKEMMHSPEVELTEIFVSNIFDGNGLACSDIPPDTKNTTRARGVHNFQILKILYFLVK